MNCTTIRVLIFCHISPLFASALGKKSEAGKCSFNSVLTIDQSVNDIVGKNHSCCLLQESSKHRDGKSHHILYILPQKTLRYQTQD